MRTLRAAVASLVTAAMLAGCGDENGGTGPAPADIPLSELIGTWQATRAEFQDRTNPATIVDVVAPGGSVVIRIDSDARAVFVADVEDEMDAATGRLSIQGERLTFAGDGNQETIIVTCELSGDTMTLVNANETYDFDGDGVEEAARLTLVCERSSNSTSVLEITGSWDAVEWEFTSDADPSRKVDAIELGATATVTIRSNGLYVLVIRPPDDPAETQSGSVRPVGDYLVTRDDLPTEEPEAFSCVLTGGFLTLATPSAEFDFDGDGIEEDASLRMVWELTVAPKPRN